MATLTYTVAYGDWSATVNLNYTTSYSYSTNKTTITFSDCTVAYSSRIGYESNSSTAITVTANDNSSSSGSATLKTTESGSGAHGGTVTYTATPNPTSITVTHSSSSGTKVINISAKTDMSVVPPGSSRVHPSGSGSTSATSATLTPCTITYNANGGSGAPSSQSGYVNVALTLSTTKPTRSSSSSNFTITGNANGGSANTSLKATKTISYSFKGWSTSKTATSASYSAGSSYTPTGNVTLYAVWGSNTSYSNNTLASLPAPTRSSTTADYSTVTCNLQGGKTGEGSSSDIALKSTKTTTYAFAGWGTSATSGVNLTSSSSYTAATTVYAQWTATTGSATSVTLPIVTKSGYNFSGWSTTSGLQEGEITTSTYTPTSTSVTLYACWNPSGMAHLYVNSEHVSALCWIYTNGEWYSCIPYMYSGGTWNICV